MKNENLIPVNSKCPICNSELIDISDDNILGAKCPNCDFGYVADNIHDWQEDETKYSIFIKSNNSMSFEKLKYIAKKCQSSCIKVKKELSINNLFFKKGLVWEIKNDIIELNKIGIEYEISPTFKYIFK